MAVTQAQKVDFLLKKIGFTKTKTGLAVDESLSGTKKAGFAEAIASPLIIANDSLWNESSQIPTTPPTSDTSQVRVYLASSSGHQMTSDSTVAGNRAFIAFDTFNDTSSTRLNNWIDTQFGASYLIKVFKGDPNSGGVQLSAAGSGNNDGWFFDYSAGVLNFNDTNVPSGVTSSNIFIVGYRYIGLTGAPTPTGGGNFTFNDLSVTGDINANGDLDVDGHTNLDNVSISGVTTATTINATTFVGALTGNVTGNVSGNSGTTTALQNARTIGGVSFDGTSNIDLPGVNIAGNQDTSGNSATTTSLQTARNIGGVSFDGTSNIDLPGVNIAGNQDTSGNSATTTALQTARTIGGVSFDGTANINLPGVNATGNQDTTGNAATSTALQTARNIGGVSFDGTSDINLPGVNAIGNQDTSGNAGTATALQNARTIGGISFDGTANINLPGVNIAGNQDTSGNSATTTALQTPRNIGGVSFDGTSDINLPGVNTAGNQDTTGNAATSTKLETARNIGGVSFDGTADINLPGVNAIGNQDTSGNAGTATALQNARTIGGVSFDGTSNIDLPGVNIAGNQNTSGNSATATALQNARTIGGVSFDGTANINLPGVNTAGNQDTSGNSATTTALQTARTIGGVSFDGTANIDLPGVNIAGNQNTSGNAGTATALETARNIGGVSFDGTSNIDLPGVNTTGNQNTSGNAATATALQNARTIGGVSFDGTSNIDLPGVNTAGNQNTSGTAAGLSGSPSIAITNLNAVDGVFSGNVSIGGTLTYEDVTNIDSVGIGTFREGIFIPDNKKIQIGNTAGNADLEIYHDGTDNIFKSNNGSSKFYNGVFQVYNGGGTTVAFEVDTASKTKLFFGGSNKLETANTGVVVSGILTATSFSGTLTGNSSTATALQTARTIGGVSFDGTANIDLPGVNIAGNQDTSGNAGTATALQNARTIGGVSFDGTANINLPGVNTAGNQDTSGNAATATALQTARNIGGVSFDGTSDISLPGVNATGNQDTSGNAATATALQNARTIGGVSFDGTSNIDLPGVNIAGNQNTSGTAAGLSGTPSINLTNLDVDGHTDLDNVSVSGITTFSGIIDAVNTPASIRVAQDIQHKGDADTKISFPSADTITFDTAGTTRLNIASDGNISVTNDIDVDGHTNLDNVNISGVTTFSGIIEGVAGENKIPFLYSNLAALPNAGTYHGMFAHVHSEGRGYFAHAGNWLELVNKDTSGNVGLSGDLDVDGHTNLDNVSVAGVTTTAGLLDINSGGQANTFKVEDLTAGRVVFAGTGGELEDSNNLRFDGSNLFVSGINVIGGGSIGPDVDTRNLKVSGLSTFTGTIDANGDLDVDGHTNLDNVSVAGVTTFSGIIEGVAGENKIPFLYANMASLPSASTYHGMFAHVHGTGKAYFAHAGNWLELVNKEPISGAITGVSTFVSIDVSHHSNLNLVSVAGVATFANRIIGIQTNNVIPFYYDNTSQFPSASTYHGAVAHAHNTGRLYFAHAGWKELVNKEANGVVGTGTEAYNIGNIVVGSGVTIESNGQATFVGIVTFGSSSTTINGNTDTVQVGTALTLGHSQGLQFHTQNLHADGFEVNQINASGIITASSFRGDGSQLTGISVDATALKDSIGNVKIQANASGAVHSGIATFVDIDVDGHTNLDNVSIAGVTTFSDTVRVGTGITLETNGQATFSGIVTASSFRGDGSQLTGISADATALKDSNGATKIQANTSGAVHTGIATFSGDATFNSTITAGGATGNNGQYLKSTGTGVAWESFPTMRTTTTVTASAGQTTFSFTYNVGFLDVFVNGVKLTDSEFTATNGSSVVLAVGCFVGDIVELVSYNTVSGGGSGSGSSTTIISPVAYAVVSGNSAGSGTGMSWGAYNSTTGQIVFTFDTAQPDANYYVHTNREQFATHNIEILSKTTTGFTTKWTNADTSLLAPSIFKGVLIVYASTPTLSVGGGGGITVQDEGSSLSTDAETLNFVGTGVVASGNGATKTITINAGTADTTDVRTNTLQVVGVSTLSDIRSDSITFKNAAGGATYATFTNGGSALLKHNNTDRIETLSIGATVTGTLYATSFVGDGSQLTNLPGGGSYGNIDVDNHLNTSSAASGEVLSWNGSDYDWVSSSSSNDAFKTIVVSGQSDIVADSTTDTLTIAAGSNVTITTDAGTDTVTIAADSGDVGITTALTGTFNASNGIAAINSYAYHNDDKVIEYTVYVKNGSDFQTSKVLAMRDGTTIHSTQFAVMFSSSLLVQFDVVISNSNNIDLRATPESGVTGNTTYRIKREVM